MAVMYLRTFETASGTEVSGSRLRTGSAEAAADEAIRVNRSYSPPEYITRVYYSGDFTDPAFAEITQLVQQHGLLLEMDDA
jgi:hypothetical protein